MRALMMILSLSLFCSTGEVAANPLESALLTSETIVNIRRDVSRLSVYLPAGTCKVNIASNTQPLEFSGSGAARTRAFLNNLSVSGAQISQSNGLLIFDTRQTVGDFGVILTIATRNGQSLKEHIDSALATEPGVQTDVVLTLLGTESEGFCSRIH